MTKYRPLVQYRFVNDRGTPLGIHIVPQGKKFGIVSREYKGDMPAPQEDWLCEELFDTRPDHATKGKIILRPFGKLTPSERWNMSSPDGDGVVTVNCLRTVGERTLEPESWKVVPKQPIDAPWAGEVKYMSWAYTMDEHTNAPYAELLREVHFRNMVISRWKYPVRAESEIDPQLPETARNKIIAVLRKIESDKVAAQEHYRFLADREKRAKRRGKDLASQADRDAEDMLQPTEKRKAKVLAALKLKSDIKVKKVEQTIHTLTLEKKTPKARTSLKVMLDGTVNLGQYDSYNKPKETEFPLTVTRRILTLSNGAKITLYSRKLTVISCWNGIAPVKSVELADEVDFKYRDGGKLTWSDAESLKKGDVVGRIFKLQWVGDWLTDGELFVPRQRPHGWQWSALPFPAVPEGLWESFLEALEGRFFAGILPFHKKFVASNKGKRRGPTLTPRQQKLQAELQGKIWKGGQSIKEVHVGRNVIFTVKIGKSTVYVVDNPGVGAIYLFAKMGEAKRLATGQWTRTETKNLGYKRIVHSRGWEGRLDSALTTWAK